MTMTAKGLAKLLEECGELIQVIGKKLPCWDTDEHWDGGDPLSMRLLSEMADVSAAIAFVAARQGPGFTEAMVNAAKAKLELFKQWDADPTNNDHGIDSHWPATLPAPSGDPVQMRVAPHPHRHPPEDDPVVWA